MIKGLIFKFFASFAKPKHIEDGLWTEDGDVYFSKKFNLRGSKAEKMVAIRNWSKPEYIEARLRDFEARSQEAFDLGRKLSQEIRAQLDLPLEDPPIPDPLPDEFKGQAQSTIRAMLRHRQNGSKGITREHVSDLIISEAGTGRRIS